MNTEIFLSLNCGQHVLFGFTVTALQGRTGRSLTITETLEVARLVMELTNESLYGDDMGECPDFKVMTDPETAYETFDEWFDENENYFVNCAQLKFLIYNFDL